MSLYTKDYFKGLSRNNQNLYEQKTRELINEARMFSESKITRLEFDIFLSHSFLDKDIIEGVFIELTKLGYKTYVDWIIDPKLDRNNVTRETAKIVRQRMSQSACLFHATSQNSSSSKWMPWETGWKDGNNKKVAILPITDTQQEKFNGQEFLSLYPYISQEIVRGNSQMLIVSPESGRTTSFDSWKNSFIFS